jgi:UDP-glucose 4-epimerase
LNNDDFTYEGTGDEIREFVNVRDAAKLSVDCLDEQYINSRLLLTGIDKCSMREIIEMIKEIIGKDVKVSFSDNTPNNHYKITPYNYDLEYSYKIVSNPYVDMGQGIIQIIRELTEHE